MSIQILDMDRDKRSVANDKHTSYAIGREMDKFFEYESCPKYEFQSLLS